MADHPEFGLIAAAVAGRGARRAEEGRRRCRRSARPRSAVPSPRWAAHRGPVPAPSCRPPCAAGRSGPPARGQAMSELIAAVDLTDKSVRFNTSTLTYAPPRRVATAEAVHARRRRTRSAPRRRPPPPPPGLRWSPARRKIPTKTPRSPPSLGVLKRRSRRCLDKSSDATLVSPRPVVEDQREVAKVRQQQGAREEGLPGAERSPRSADSRPSPSSAFARRPSGAPNRPSFRRAAASLVLGIVPPPRASRNLDDRL
jgi:hypothetical protein